MIEDLSERRAAGNDDAGRLAVAVEFHLAAWNDIGIAADIELGHRLRRQQQPVIEMLDIDGMVARDIRDLLRVGAALLGKLLLGPAAGDDDPGARLLRLRGVAD